MDNAKATLNTSLNRATLFFAKHAGSATPPGRMACARELAKAERWAEGILTFKWEWDDCPDLSDCDTCEHLGRCRDRECLRCKYWSRHEHEILAVSSRYMDGSQGPSLGGIEDSDEDYRRVVEAELALEAMAEVEESLERT